MAIAALTNNLEKIACTREQRHSNTWALSVTWREASCIIIVIYRPWSQVVNFMLYDELVSLVERLSTLSMQLLITGDINILDRLHDLHTLCFNDILHHLVMYNTYRSGILDTVVKKTESQSPNLSVKDVGLSEKCDKELYTVWQSVSQICSWTPPCCCCWIYQQLLIVFKLTIKSSLTDFR